MNPAAATVGAVVAVTLAVCGVGAIAAITLVSSDGCMVEAEPVDLSGRWSPEQVANATTIVEVGARMRVPSYGWVIAIAIAIQESGLRNLGDLGERNDHDSIGLFQQRPSQGWGTPEQVMDPVYASTKFYEKLLTVDAWQQLSLTVAAQRVQVSAFPGAYAKQEADARRIVNTVAARQGLAVDCAGGWVLPLPAGSYTLTSPYGPRWGTHHDSELSEFDGVPFRTCRPEQEEQATALAGTLLLPRPLLMHAASRGMGPEEIATRCRVTVEMARYRYNTTGVVRQLGTNKR